jgi:hypothetical protein
VLAQPTMPASPKTSKATFTQLTKANRAIDFERSLRCCVHSTPQNHGRT